jgi:hypothetical protein
MIVTYGYKENLGHHSYAVKETLVRTTRLLIENRKNRTSRRFHIRNNTKRVLDRLEDVYSLGP